MEIPQTLLVTNDFPPRVGGIQRTLHALVRELPAHELTVLAPTWERSDEFDSDEPYGIVRPRSRFLWPTPATRRMLWEIVEGTNTRVVLFGDAMPLAAMGPSLAGRGIPYLVAAHGFDYWLSLLPGGHAGLAYMTSRAARVPVMCSAFIARVVRTAVPDDVPVSVMYPGADVEVFHPGLPTGRILERHGLTGRPVVACVSRLVPRKGQDVLIRAMALVQRRVPDAALLIVGDGPYRPTLERMAALAPTGSIVLAGQVSEADLPTYYATGDVFAMPCRTRLGGLEVEGWGNVFIEAAACGRPVVVGNSGGARESVVDGETGILVDGRNVEQVADAISTLLEDPALAERMGKAGRERVERFYTWPRAAEQLGRWLRAAVA